jgi:hypothetical protein
MQITNWIGDRPYATESETLSIGSDKLVYSADETAEFRVRLRDNTGAPRAEADLRAVLYRDGEIYGEVELEADPNMPGIYRARSGRLPPGKFEVAITESSGGEMPQRMEFQVEIPPNLEFGRPMMNQPALENMASQSGGRFFLEEDVASLPDLLESLDQKQVFTEEKQLAFSWWWFLPIIGMLTAEWILRKKSGYV